MKLGLGTAQFGMRYGISNQRGKISADEVPALLGLAIQSGIEILDTAPAYGDSELALGRAQSASRPFRIVTKAPALRNEQGPDVANLLRRALGESLRKLQRSSVYGYLVHDPRDLLGPTGEHVVEALAALKREKLVEKIGVSVYTAADIDAILSHFVPDIVQLPISIFDQRLLASGHLAALKHKGVEVHARSIFLQGLVLMQAAAAPAYFSTVTLHLDRFSRFTDATGLTRLEAALAFIAQVPEVDVALVGVTGIRELEEIIRVVGRNADRCVRIADAADWAINNERILNPALWPGAVTGGHA